jgi:Glycosyltransferase family 87
MRLIGRLFVFVSSLFIVLYGVLPGLFKLEGNFIASFVAGRSFLHGVDPVIFYRFPLFQRLVDMSGLGSGIFSYVTNMPSSIVADAVLAIPPASVARFLFTAANIMALILVVHVTAKIAQTSNRTAYIVFLSSSFALASGFQSSQPFLILTLLYVLAMYAFSINRNAACGAFLGLAFPFSPLTAIPAALFLISAKWRAFAYFAVIAVATLALTYIVVGQSAFVYYVQRILPAYINGRIFNPFSSSYQTAWAFFRRLFLYNQTLNVHPSINSTTAYLVASAVFKASVVVPSAYFFYKGINLGKPRETLAAASFPIIFLSPTGTAPQLVLLAPAIVVLVQSALDDGQRRTARAFMVLYAAACLPINSFLEEYLRISGPFTDYEGFLLLFAIYVLYLVFQRRIVPAHLRAARAGLTAIVVAAVSLTLYVGDQSAQPSSALPIRPALEEAAMGEIGFSPGLRSGKLTCIGYDSSAANLAPHGIDVGKLAGHNIFRYSSDQSGHSYAIETVENGKDVSFFRTRGDGVFFDGRHVTVSRDGDYGAFMRKGTIYILDLDPRFISPIDTLSILPYNIRSCSFNSGVDNELVFLIDSLNSSYSIGTYNLFSRKITTRPVPFLVSLICSDGDDYYVTQDVADSTRLYVMTGDSGPVNLLAMRGSIYDIAVLDHSLYLSSDYRRGLDYPTVYKYVKALPTPPGR